MYKGLVSGIRAQTWLMKTSSKPRNAMGGTFRETYERYVRNKMGNFNNDGYSGRRRFRRHRR